MTAYFPSLPPNMPYKLRIQSTALPPNGCSMLKSSHFPNLLLPAKFASKQAIGEAIRCGRLF